MRRAPGAPHKAASCGAAPGVRAGVEPPPAAARRWVAALGLCALGVASLALWLSTLLVRAPGARLMHALLLQSAGTLFCLGTLLKPCVQRRRWVFCAGCFASLKVSPLPQPRHGVGFASGRLCAMVAQAS